MLHFYCGLRRMIFWFWKSCIDPIQKKNQNFGIRLKCCFIVFKWQNQMYQKFTQCCIKWFFLAPIPGVAFQSDHFNVHNSQVSNSIQNLFAIKRRLAQKQHSYFFVAFFYSTSRLMCFILNLHCNHKLRCGDCHKTQLN